MVVRLAHLCIESNNLEATETFYGYLGIKRQFRTAGLPEVRIGMGR